MTDGSSSPSPSSQEQPKEAPGQWGLILKPGHKTPHDVRMKDDTGTKVNWIHPYLVDRCKLKRETCETRTFRDMGGKIHNVKEFVWFTWAGRGNLTYSDRFYIANPKSNVDVVLGKIFVDEYGRAEKVCAPDPWIQDAHVLTDGPQQPGEEDAAQASQANQAKLSAEAERKKQEKKDKVRKDKAGGSSGRKKK